MLNINIMHIEKTVLDMFLFFVSLVSPESIGSKYCNSVQIYGVWTFVPCIHFVCLWYKRSDMPL